MDPQKADILEAIDRTGSIAEAARSVGMSYRHVWLQVDAMNRCWNEPLVEASVGGSHGGTSRMTACGRDVLTAYRRMEQGARDTPDLADRLRPAPRLPAATGHRRAAGE